MTTNIPQKAGGDFPGYEYAFQSLEGRIDRVLAFSRAQRLIGQVATDLNTQEFRNECVEVLSFLADEAFEVAEDLEQEWLALHNVGCGADWKKRGVDQ